MTALPTKYDVTTIILQLPTAGKLFDPKYISGLHVYSKHDLKFHLLSYGLCSNRDSNENVNYNIISVILGYMFWKISKIVYLIV